MSQRINQSQLITAIGFALVGLFFTFVAQVNHGFELAQYSVPASLVFLGIVAALAFWRAGVTREGNTGRGAEGPIALAGIAFSLAAGVTAFFMHTIESLGAVLVAWAISRVVILTLKALNRGELNYAGLAPAGLATILTLCLVWSMGNLTAMVGFFGAYAVIKAVFLGIAAFDKSEKQFGSETERGFAKDSGGGQGV